MLFVAPPASLRTLVWCSSLIFEATVSVQKFCHMDHSPCLANYCKPVIFDVAVIQRTFRGRTGSALPMRLQIYLKVPEDVLRTNSPVLLNPLKKMKSSKIIYTLTLVVETSKSVNIFT